MFRLLWKKESLIGLKKVSTPSSLFDFRRIALLCFLSKALEKFAHDQIVAYLKNAKILDPFLVGFKKHHCAQPALMKLKNDILTGMGEKQASLLSQFDFSKAFDPISLSKLLVKLRDLGFSNMDLLVALWWSQCVFSGSTSFIYRKTSLAGAFFGSTPLLPFFK